MTDSSFDNPDDNFQGMRNSVDSSNINPCLLSDLDGAKCSLQSMHAQTLKEVRDVVRVLGKDRSECLAAVDFIQRLGIDHHFQDDIKSILTKQHLEWEDTHQQAELYQVALCFRLLRQHGYTVSADVFQRFQDKDGKFREELSPSINGWISLYEATQLCMEGEDILVEAELFCCHLLNAVRARCGYNQVKLIERTLNHPYHKTLPRFMTKNFIGDISSKAKKWERDLKHLAMMDYEIVQSQHKMEAQQFFTWWNNTGLAKEMKLAKDLPMKWFMHSTVALHPKHSQLRVNITKIVSLVYIIDDIFDVYGSLDNLIIFTEAVQRWDYAEAEELPHYMKSCLRVLFDTTEEFANEIHQVQGFNPTSYLQKVWANLFDAFLVEATWFANKHLPLPDEYLKNGTVSTGMHVILLHLFFMLCEKTYIIAEFLNENSRGMVNSAAAMLRLLDDLDSATVTDTCPSSTMPLTVPTDKTDETQVGKDGSYVDCYMQEHKGITHEMARNHVKLMISDLWKRLNSECLVLSPYSALFTNYTLNVVRILPLMYDHERRYTLPGFEE
uniref:Uncharacterized protein n=1 Tax=Kalanchoe fedtschenkoi TaxID=63787 RepID=A0A7N0V1J6_KALFE